MSTNKQTIAISGASSGIGQVLLKLCQARGIEVIELNRTKEGFGFDLSQEIHTELPSVSAFIHLAWAWDANLVELERINVTNLLPLLNRMHQDKVRMVLLSTDSVLSRQTSEYGQTKYQLESEFLARGGSAVRAGFIWGSELSGILLTVKNLSGLPLLCPHLAPDPTFNISNVDELARILLASVTDSESKTGIFSLASEEKVSLSRVSHVLRGEKRTMLHLRIKLTQVISIFSRLQSLGLKLPFRLDSLRALLPTSGRPTAGLDESMFSQYSVAHFCEWLETKRWEITK